MGLFTQTHLGARYDLFDYKVRTWHSDRHDYHAEREIRLYKEFRNKHQRSFDTVKERREICAAEEGIIEEDCEIGRNYRDSNPDFRLVIHENREWDVNSGDWVPDGRFVVDFVFPYDSDFKFPNKEKDIREGSVEPEDLKKMADFIYGFIENCQIWGANSTTQTKVKRKGKEVHNSVKQYRFKSPYLFNYYINDEKKKTEKVNFNIAINKYDYGIEGFEAFTMKIADYQMSKEIQQFIDIVMTPLQLKEFADFIYKALGKDLINKM